MKIKKGKWFVALIVVAMLFSLLPSVGGAAVPVDPAAQAMYADAYTAGDAVTVQLPAANVARLNPENALGPFDALQTDGVSANQYFFAVASREWTNYTFEDVFCNVDWAPAIEFAEVTWGNTWHPEAVKVYLTDAYVWDNGEAVPYEDDDSGLGVGNSYYAGVAWNKVGIQLVSASDQNDVANNYLPLDVTRDFQANIFRQDGNFGITEFYLPDEIAYATGITVVDITGDVYNLASLARARTYTGNTDGYDLDAIRVYRCAPYVDGDTATGVGERIKTKGTWFMYNVYPGDTQGVYDLQAGNPKDGENIIGSYSIADNGDGTFTATYDIDSTIEIGGWTYDIVVVDEHLAISQTMNFTAAPGRDDNADWGVPFEAEAPFFVFAHFAVDYK